MRRRCAQDERHAQEPTLSLSERAGPNVLTWDVLQGTALSEVKESRNKKRRGSTPTSLWKPTLSIRLLPGRMLHRTPWGTSRSASLMTTQTQGYGRSRVGQVGTKFWRNVQHQATRLNKTEKTAGAKRPGAGDLEGQAGGRACCRPESWACPSPLSPGKVRCPSWSRHLDRGC